MAGEGSRRSRWYAWVERWYWRLLFPILLILFGLRVRDHGWDTLSVSLAVCLGLCALVMLAMGLQRVFGSDAVKPVPVRPTDEVRAEVRALAHAGKRVEAVRVMREHTGMGLLEAVDAVNEAEATDPVYRAR